MSANIFTATTEEWMADRRRRAAEYEAEQRAEFFASFKGDRPIPDIEFDYPPCPICTGDLTCDGSWWCDACCVGWDNNGGRGEFDRKTAAEIDDHPAFLPHERGEQT